MKKWNVIYWVFFCLFFIIWLYFEFYIKSDSLYWLVSKLTGFAVILISQVLIIFFEKKESKASIIGRICVVTLFLCYFGYQSISKYKSDACDDRFGPEFNIRRRKLSTPEIPVDWQVNYKGRGSGEWKAKKTVGHTRKYVRINSSCEAMYEDDDYNLKPVNGKSRSVSINTRYADRKGIDSIFYRYQLGDSSRLISRQQADSIFAAEKIKKDY